MIAFDLVRHRAFQISTLTFNDLRQRLEKIAHEKIYPTPTPLVTVVPEDAVCIDEFVTPPQLMCLDDEDDMKLSPQITINEAEIIKSLKHNQHPNLVRYYGCTVQRSRITGIVLERHDMVRNYRFRDDVRDLDVDACMNGIRAGVRHLHSLGLAHNDLNSTNISFGKNGNPIIFNFRSCKEI